MSQSKECRIDRTPCHLKECLACGDCSSEEGIRLHQMIQHLQITVRCLNERNTALNADLARARAGIVPQLPAYFEKLGLTWETLDAQIEDIPAIGYLETALSPCHPDAAIAISHLQEAYPILRERDRLHTQAKAVEITDAHTQALQKGVLDAARAEYEAWLAMGAAAPSEMNDFVHTKLYDETIHHWNQCREQLHAATRFWMGGGSFD